MLHPETHAVTATNGPRPKGPPDECFYCRQKIGAEHKPACVMRQKTVVAEVCFHIVLPIPESWGERQFDRWAHDQIGTAEQIERQLERLATHCIFPFDHATLLRDATEQDEEDQCYTDPGGGNCSAPS